MGADVVDEPDASGLGPWARTWVEEALGTPTPVQADAWPVLAQRRDAVLIAPTGSGKTLAAFLSALDRLARTPTPERGRVLYVSPLKALASDIERNLRSPLVGLQQVAERHAGTEGAGGSVPEPVRVAVRTGDTPQAERTRQAKNPPDVWITTPESLYLLLTSRARSALMDVDTVIIDEIHALVGTKRGAHLAVSLERLEALAHSRPIQRIALSATVQPISEVARFVRAQDPDSVAIIAPPIDKKIEIDVESTVADFDRIGETVVDESGNDVVSGSAAGDAERESVWPSVAARVVDVVAQHRSSIVFVNSRRLAERLTARINEIAEDRREQGDREGSRLPVPLARAHHGSVAKELRRGIEDDLKQGRLRTVVATSSMELGIDMGDVDVVIQIQSPPSVASGLQRVGRAGHGVGETSVGHVIATHAHDLLIARTVGEEMIARHIEDVHIPMLPLDVLAQQIVAMCAMDDYPRADLAALVRGAAPFTTLSDALLDSVLAMLSGTYPSDRFAELRPRLVWDRATDTLTARPGAARLAVTNAGTIPDRGLFGVHVATEGMPRVGELDEEMVYETRAGEVITLGASSWRVEEITHDRVLVSPAPGASGRMPFWHGDALGRPSELAAAIGRTVREDQSHLPALERYLTAQRDATGVVPDERNLLVEAFRDEIGDWRIVIHSPYGARVHAPWALALRLLLVERLTIEPQVMHADDGIVLRLPDVAFDPREVPESPGEYLIGEVIEALSIDPADIESLVHQEVTGSALFASRFRECAARSLLLPRRRPDRRTPLWQQRQRAHHLLEVASDFPDFPIVLETMRECVHDAYDLPALTSLLTSVRDGRVRFEAVTTDRPSPFARSLLFGYVATYLYEGDAPLAERRAQALSVDMDLLADLLGTAELRTLLDADALADVEDDLAHRSERFRARDMEDAADLLRIVGPMDAAGAQACGIDTSWLSELRENGRAINVRIAGRDSVAAVEDAGRLRDGLGVLLPPGIPDAHLQVVADPLGDLLGRYARTHGPFTADQIAQAFGIPIGAVLPVLARMAAEGVLLRGEFRPGGSGEEYCDREVLRRIRRSSVARLRAEIEPVGLSDYARFLLEHSGVHAAEDPPTLTLTEAIDRLTAYVMPASSVLASIRARIPDADVGDIDALLSSGALTWWGHGRLGTSDMTIAWAPTAIAGDMRGMLRDCHPLPELDDNARAVLAILRAGGSFDTDSIHAALVRSGSVISHDHLDSVLWDLAALGWLTCDSWSAVAARVGSNGRRPSHRRTTVRSARPHRTARARLPRRTRLDLGNGGPRWSLAAGIRGTDLVDLGSDSNPTDVAAAVIAAPTEGSAAEYAGVLLERWAVVSRLVVAAEQPIGGFAGQYRVLSTMAEAGACQRVYAVDGAGGAQFAMGGAVDDLRASAARTSDRDYLMSAVDPANPFGTLLPWPGVEGESTVRPARRNGAMVSLHGAQLRAFVEASGTKAATWGVHDEDAAVELLRQLAAGRVRLTRNKRALLIEVDGISLIGGSAHGAQSAQQGIDWGQAARAAGFLATPRGYRWPSDA